VAVSGSGATIARRAPRITAGTSGMMTARSCAVARVMSRRMEGDRGGPRS